jgi:hypothetical protein
MEGMCLEEGGLCWSWCVLSLDPRSYNHTNIHLRTRNYSPSKQYKTRLPIKALLSILSILYFIHFIFNVNIQPL